MYSVVLMMALSGGTEAVDFGHRGGRCHGGSGGCSGMVYSGYRGAGCCGSYRGGCGGMVYGGGCTGGMVYGGGCTGTYGCTGIYGCAGGAYSGGVMMAPSRTTSEIIRVPPKKTPEEAQGPAPATILVSLPASARLTIDNVPTTSTSGLRTLVTPALEPGNIYVYTLRAEVNGTTQTQDIRVRAGQTSEAQFAFPVSSITTR